MKKLAVLLLALSMIFVTSCGNNNTQTAQTAQTTADTQATAVQEKTVCNKITVTYRPDSQYPYPDTEFIDVSPDTKTELCEIMEKYIRACKTYLDTYFFVFVEWSGAENADRLASVQTGFPSVDSRYYDWKDCKFTRLAFELKGVSLSELDCYEPLYDMLYELAQNDDVVKIYVGSCPYLPANMG